MRHQKRSVTAGPFAALFLTTVVWLAAIPALAADVTLNCPAAIALGVGQFIGEVSVETGGGALGAYTLAVTYDTGVLRVVSVAGGTTPELAGNPITNPADFPTGRARLAAFNTSNLTSPVGTVTVARITFAVVDTVSSSAAIGLEIITLADTDGTRIAADAQGCTVAIGPPPEHTLTPTPVAKVTPTPPPDPTHTPAPRCLGDCGGDGAVTVEEVLVLVNIGLHIADPSVCAESDTDSNGEITVDEILMAVNAVLLGCPLDSRPSS